MAFVQLTRLVEKKTKGTHSGGDLTTIGYAESGPIWVSGASIVALTPQRAPVEVDEETSETRDVTELILAGVHEPIMVGEAVQDVIGAL